MGRRIKFEGMEVRYSPEVVKEALLSGLHTMGLVNRARVEHIRPFNSHGQVCAKVWIKKPVQAEMFPTSETPTA